MVLVAPGAGELFYLRSILLHCAAGTWDDLKNINRNTYNTYQETAREMGLFANKGKSILAMKEAVDNYYSPAQFKIFIYATSVRWSFRS